MNESGKIGRRVIDISLKRLRMRRRSVVLELGLMGPCSGQTEHGNPNQGAAKHLTGKIQKFFSIAARTRVRIGSSQNRFQVDCSSS